MNKYMHFGIQFWDGIEKDLVEKDCWSTFTVDIHIPQYFALARVIPYKP